MERTLLKVVTSSINYFIISALVLITEQTSPQKQVMQLTTLINLKQILMR